MSTVWMFPGHGSQYVGMAQALLRDTDAGRAWLTRAELASGLPLARYVARGPVSELTKPTVLEPLLTAISCAYADWLVACGHHPAAVAGYSAGEVGAMYAAQVFDAETCMRIACLRGHALETAAAAQPGGMLSMYGLPAADLIKLALEAGHAEPVGVAAHNGPRHITVAGTAAALRRAAANGRTHGAGIGSIDAAGPWHTSLVDMARQQISAAIARLSFSAPRVPVWLGSSGAICGDGDGLRDSIAGSIVVPVHWNAVIGGLLAAGIDDFLEVGPGRTLCGLLGQTPLPPRVTRGFLDRPWLKRLRPPMLSPPMLSPPMLSPPINAAPIATCPPGYQQH